MILSIALLLCSLSFLSTVLTIAWKQSDRGMVFILRRYRVEVNKSENGIAQLDAWEGSNLVASIYIGRGPEVKQEHFLRLAYLVRQQRLKGKKTAQGKRWMKRFVEQPGRRDVNANLHL